MNGGANVSNTVSPSPKRRKEQGETGSVGEGDDGSEGSPEKRSKTDEEALMPSVANKGFGQNDNTVAQQDFPFMKTKDGHRLQLLPTRKGTYQNVAKGIMYHPVQVQGKPMVGSAIVVSKTTSETEQDTNPWIEVNYKRNRPIKPKEDYVFKFSSGKTTFPPNQIPAKKGGTGKDTLGLQKEHQQPITESPLNQFQPTETAPTTTYDQQKPSGKVTVDQPMNQWKTASQLTQKHLPVTMLEGEERIVEIAMDLPAVKEETILSNQSEQMKFVLKQILHRGRKIAGNKNLGFNQSSKAEPRICTWGRS